MDMTAYRANLERLGVSQSRPPAVPEDRAGALLDRMLAQGATFEVMGDYLLWFGPRGTATPEIAAEVARLKAAIVRLLSGGYPRSRRTWGEPTAQDWENRPDAEERPR